MALVAMTTADTVDFVSVNDPSRKVTKVLIDPENPDLGSKDEVTIEEGASVFKLRPLDVFLMGWIYDSASVLRGRQGDNEIGVHTRINQTNIDAVRFGLAAIPSNFRHKDNSPVRLVTEKEIVNGRQYDVVKKEVLNTLGLQLISEMADEIRKISSVTRNEEKN
jgi:hypothetical protein